MLCDLFIAVFKSWQYRRGPRTFSVQYFIAVSSDPNELISTLVCFLLIQYIDAWCRNAKSPDRDVLVIENRLHDQHLHMLASQNIYLETPAYELVIHLLNHNQPQT